MRQIPLTQGLVTIVDDDVFDALNAVKWNAHQCGKSFYAGRLEYGPIKCKRIYMHRVIINVPEGMCTDHINGDPLDNRKSNLRICTSMQNARNSKKRNGKQHYKGVYPTHHRYGGVDKYNAVITVNYKQIYLGTFNTAIEAAAAYDKAAKKFHGEFARTNFHE